MGKLVKNTLKKQCTIAYPEPDFSEFCENKCVDLQKSYIEQSLLHSKHCLYYKFLS